MSFTTIYSCQSTVLYILSIKDPPSNIVKSILSILIECKQFGVVKNHINGCKKIDLSFKHNKLFNLLYLIYRIPGMSFLTIWIN